MGTTGKTLAITLFNNNTRGSSQDMSLLSLMSPALTFILYDDEYKYIYQRPRCWQFAEVESRSVGFGHIPKKTTFQEVT